MKKKEKAFVLIVVLTFLTIMTMISIFMFSGFTQDQRMAGDFREKSRALDAAQTALTSAEIYLSQQVNVYTGPDNWVSGTACAANGSNTPATVPIICNTPLVAPTAIPWSSFTTYTPSGMSLAPSGQNTYASNTNIHIYYMGTTSTNPPAAVYQLTAMAKGGNDATAVVAQTVIRVTATSIDLGG